VDGRVVLARGLEMRSQPRTRSQQRQGRIVTA
jgi:hypothetical protein